MSAAANKAPAMALRAAPRAQEGTRIQKLLCALARLAAGFLLALGLLWGLADLLGLDVDIAPLALAVLAGTALGAFAPMSERARFAPALVAAAVLVAVLIAAGASLTECVRAFWSSCAMRLADTTSARLPELALASPDARASNAALFLLVVAPFAGALCAGLAGMQRRWWLAPVALGCIAVACVEDLQFGPGALVCTALGCALALGACGSREAGVAASGASGTARAMCAALACVAALAGVAAAALVAPADTWRQPEPLANARTAAAGGIHDLRYGSSPNALPSGALSSLRAWSAGEGDALVLEGEKLQPMYLRGYVGTTRSTDGWATLDQSAYHESDALFWWLHERGFSAQGQLHAALGAALQDAEAAGQAKQNRRAKSAKTQTVSVKNVGASSEYAYVPYGFSAFEGELACKDRADETFAPRGLFGSRSYAFAAMQGAEVVYPDIAALQWVARDEKSGYWRDESNYNQFVYAHYAENTESDEALVTSVLGEAGVTNQAHVDYASAASAVVEWLDSEVAYDESVGAPADGKDLLVDFLTSGKRGWSVHYASAAVAMLRHFGIPARYVEGYVVMPQDIEGAAEGAVAVPASNGHAWAEMYVDGTGWVPVETVARMRAAMPQPDWAAGIQADGSRHASIPPAPQQVEQPEESKSIGEALIAVLFGLGVALLVLLVAFDVFALVFFLVSLVRRILARRRRARAFASPDDTAASRAMAAWAASIARFEYPQLPAGDARVLRQAMATAYGDALADDFETTQRVGRKAAFSQHGATVEEREGVSEAAQRFARGVYAAQDLHARWIMKYIERLM